MTKDTATSSEVGLLRDSEISLQFAQLHFFLWPHAGAIEQYFLFGSSLKSKHSRNLKTLS